jgi:RNA polymerase sigma factor (sigma-70 family)
MKDRPTESMSPDDEGQLNPEHERALEAAGHGLPAPDARLMEEADRRVINQGMQALPTVYREILILREIEELSYQDISEIADIPIGTVMSLLSRARASLLRWVSGRLAESRGAMR